jgi:predicted DNA-binding protein
MYDNPKHRKLKERTLRFDPYHDDRLCQVAASLGLQPAVLGRELVEMGVELMGDKNVNALAKKLKCSKAALIQQLVAQGALELKAMLEDKERLRA